MLYPLPEPPDYEKRVQAYETQGMTRSDAQGTVDAEEMRKAQNKERGHIHEWEKPFAMAQNEADDILWCMSCDATKDSDGGIIE